MPSNTNVPRRDRDGQELVMAVLFLALTLGLLITASAVYLVLVHPSVAEPVAVGAAVLGALTGVGGIVGRVLTRGR
ncbi:hypothetical protein [Streptomyces sp. NRRL F-2580]|uniref:hypothetical protein n=1 Tax=Streptomyces sp. NRRL F-2580 TaxID=1463841 RepID=UPI0004C5A4DA|nr:hypothetical protein [Streptomyces sp. NRRL F-2580]